MLTQEDEFNLLTEDFAACKTDEQIHDVMDHADDDEIDWQAFADYAKIEVGSNEFSWDAVFNHYSENLA